MNENWVRLPILTAIASCLMPVTNLYASDSTGATIYAQHCANCHGADGQGADDGYQQPIFGDDSVAELASYIDRKMPEGEHELCVGDDARLVARYIYDEFYSFAAQQRKGLVSVPRIELSRLTVEQYRNAVADLVGSFAPQPRPTDQPGLPGLAAEYFQSDGMNKADKRKLERIDRQVDFDFGDEGPTDDIAADQFCVIWQGTIHPRHTGDYEFRIRTPNGVRLYVNCDPSRRQGSLRDDSSAAGQTALIDGWVSSGGMREHTAKVYLLGGRAYPIRLEFFKYKEELASVTMEWRPPLGVWSTLDHHHLSTTDAPRTFCVDTPFPPDDRSRGYERGSAVSREWYAAVSEGAIATANEVIDRLPALADLRDEKDSRREKVVEFLQRFAQTAFRRPLTDSERSVLDQMSTVDEASDEAVVRRVVLYVLSSPYFLYVDLTPPSQAPTAYTVASRLSFALWDSLPDAELLAAAERDELLGVEQLERQARRMLADPKSRQKLQGFFAGWLEIGQRDLAKDKDLFPEFDEAVVADLRESLEQFLDQIVWSDASDYRQLLLADYLLLNARLRQLYVVATDDQDGDDKQNNIDAGHFVRVEIPEGRRAGVLTHPYLLSAFSYHNSTSPIHRGVFLTRNIVGRKLKPPPVAVAFNNEEFPAELTMREKVTQLTRDAACASCHAKINPLGFALENFDAVGRWRLTDNEQPVDARSQYETATGQLMEVDDATDIATYAASNPAAHRAFVLQMFRYLTKQVPYAYGAETVSRLTEEFQQDSFNIQELAARIAVMAAGYGQKR